MRTLVIKNESKGAKWTEVTIHIPESLTEAKEAYGDINNGFLRFMLHSLPIKIRQTCKNPEQAQEVANKLFIEPLNSRITGSEKSRLYNDLADFGFERKELKGLTVDGLEKLLKALRKVPITSPPEK